jgi:putative MATE family efflux protein
MKVLDFSDQRYWRLILATGIPIMVQNLIFNSFTLVDNILVGGLGEVNIAAVGVANKFTFIFMLFLFGINSGTNIFSAQYWGKRDLKGVRRVLGLSLGLGLMVSIPFTLTALLAPHIIIDIFSNDPEVIRLGAQYLTIVGLTFPINAIASSFSMQSRGVGRAKVPLVASSVGFLLNAFLDYALIYGKFGFPQMGIQGAALATLVSKVLECLVLLGIIYYNKYELAARFSEFNGYSREFLLRFFRPVLPVILNEMFWAVGVSFYTYFYGILGTDAVATVQILDVVNSIFVSAFMGLGHAVGAVIGNLIGAGEEDLARIYAKRSALVSVGFGLVMSFLLLLIAPSFLNLFNITESTRRLCELTIVVYAIYMIPKIINHLMIVGVLRGGGDTVFAGLLDVAAPWLIGIPMAYLGVRVLGWPIYLSMALINLEELVKAMVGIGRLLSGKWLHNLVNESDPPDPVEQVPTMA